MDRLSAWSAREFNTAFPPFGGPQFYGQNDGLSQPNNLMVSDPTPQQYDSSMDRFVQASNRMVARPTSPQIFPELIDRSPFSRPGSEIFPGPINRPPFRRPGSEIIPETIDQPHFQPPGSQIYFLVQETRAPLHGTIAA